jgi:hypothetical protein
MEKYVAAKGLRTYAVRQRHLTKYTYPTLGKTPIQEITRRQIIELVDGIATNNGPVMARRVAARRMRAVSLEIDGRRCRRTLCSQL